MQKAAFAQSIRKTCWGEPDYFNDIWTRRRFDGLGPDAPLGSQTCVEDRDQVCTERSFWVFEPSEQLVTSLFRWHDLRDLSVTSAFLKTSFVVAFFKNDTMAGNAAICDFKPRLEQFA